MGLFKRLFGESEPKPIPGSGGGPQNSDRLFPPLSVAPLDYNRFEPTDVAGWRAALDRYGFVILSGVLSATEVSIATSLLWDHLEARTAGDRRDPSSWIVWPDESFRFGMIQREGTHCDGVWYVRGLPGVRTAFAHLFCTRELHVSFDGFPALRPAPAVGQSSRDWYHIDHALGRRGRWLAQGLVALTPSGAEDGGLVVWPCSHHLFATGWGTQAPSEPAPRGILNDFEMLKEHPAAAAAMPRDTTGLGPVKVSTAAGDLVLWDTRTVHCNAPLGPIPNGSRGAPALADLLTAATRVAGMGSQTADDSWAAQPMLEDRAGREYACSCAVCRGEIASQPSAPLGRLGVYVCMQPAAQTKTTPQVREAMLRRRAWTGHVPFRDVEGIGHGDALITSPLPSLVARCRIRRALAGLEWGRDEGEPSEYGPHESRIP